MNAHQGFAPKEFFSKHEVCGLIREVTESGVAVELCEFGRQYPGPDGSPRVDLCGLVDGIWYAETAFSKGPMTANESGWGREYQDEAEAVRQFCEAASGWSDQDWQDRLVAWEHVAAVELWKLMFILNERMRVNHEAVFELLGDWPASAKTRFQEKVYRDEHYIHAFARGMLWVYLKLDVATWPRRKDCPFDFDFGFPPELDSDSESFATEVSERRTSQRREEIELNEQSILRFGVTAEELRAMSDDERAELAGRLAGDARESPEPEEEQDEFPEPDNGD